MVEKILLSKSDDGSVVATGVKYSIKGESHTSYSRKEVILSAGTFNSPALLELSGIGDEALLSSLGIPIVIANSNVGENLQDHPMNINSVEVVNEDDSMDSLRDPKKLEAVIRQYAEQKSGPLASGFNAMAYMPVGNLFGPEDREVLKTLISEHIDNRIDALTNAQRIQTSYLKSVLLDSTDSTCNFSGAPGEIFPLYSPQGINSISLVVALVHPFSRGSCHIQSADPGAYPKIDPKYLSHPLDLEVFARHILYISKVISTEPLASMLKAGGKMNPPNGPLKTLEEAKEWAIQSTGCQFHPSGTCSMMPKELGGVVSDRLIVHGTKNLRIVDASIFPIIPKGPITSTVYAVAERAADLIKEDFRFH